MKKPTSSNYTKDKLYPAVARAVAEICKTSDVVAPVELLLHMQRITKQQYEDWRFGRIPYLENVNLGCLSKMNRILRILDLHCRALKLTPSPTVYRKWGKGGKRIVLRFSKSGHPNLEAAYSRHYIAKAMAKREPSGPRCVAGSQTRAPTKPAGGSSHAVEAMERLRAAAEAAQGDEAQNKPA
jgi:hypothetical protein